MSHEKPSAYLLLETVDIVDGHMTHNYRIWRKNVVVEKRTSLFAGFDVMLFILPVSLAAEALFHRFNSCPSLCKTLLVYFAWCSRNIIKPQRC